MGDRIVTWPNALSAARLAGVPVFLWLVVGPRTPEADLNTGTPASLAALRAFGQVTIRSPTRRILVEPDPALGTG